MVDSNTRIKYNNERLFTKGFVMAISSVGVGSGILTQDVLDQLRKADEAAQITPIDLSIANEKDKKSSFDVLDATMKNLIDSIDEIKNQALFDERKTTIMGTSVEVTASANSDLQDFTLNVTQLATKQIEESGSFAAKTDTIASASGSVNLNIDGQDFTINYDATTTLEDFKKSINDVAGTKVDATIVQLSDGDFRLFISSDDTGTTQDITITDNDGNLNDTKLTSDFTAIQTGVDANFEFNGQAITRTSNDISDLITGYDITLKELGSSSVKVEQNRENIMDKIDSFVSKYNAAVTELGKLTKSSTDSDVRGIFSSESTVKGLKSTIDDLLSNVGGGVGSLIDYGFDIAKDGQMSIDKDVLNQKLDDSSSNVEAFFSGGTYTDVNGTVELTGAFTEMSNIVGGYTDYNATLDQFKTSISDNITSLEERKTAATERLDNRYDILKKQFISYDLMISKLNSASSMFTQLANAQTNSNN